MFEGLQSNWQGFWYNFSWDDYSGYLNGAAAKASVLVPLLGYAVLFNDYVTEHFEFKNLTNQVQTTFFLHSSSRIRFIFLGLLALATANILYRVFRPFAIRIGETERDYKSYFLNYATAGTFLRLHLEIKQSGYDPWTQDGKYYDDEWDLFWREATWPLSGQNELQKENLNQKLVGYETVNFSEAKQRHESLLLSILRETYFREGRERRYRLLVCLFFGTLGYILLLIPSFDLVLRVLQVSIWDPLTSKII